MSRWHRLKRFVADLFPLPPNPMEGPVEAFNGLDTGDSVDSSHIFARPSQTDLPILRTGGAFGIGFAPATYPKHSLAIDQVLCNRFVIKQFINAGGMGEVYSAWDKELGSEVALKTIRGEVSADALRRFLKEVVRARQVSHRNVCRVYDLFCDAEHSNIRFLTMELLDGSSLAQQLENGGALSVDRAAVVLRQLADGLAAAHIQGIIHRDLKPANVMLVEESAAPRAVITDFGLALVLAETAADSATPHRSGTVAYMAPEQLQDGAVSTATDVYSFGKLAAALLDDTARDERVPGGRYTWRDLIRRCTAADPRARFTGGVELREAINAPRPIKKSRYYAAALLAFFTVLAIQRYLGRRVGLSSAESKRLTYHAGLATSASIGDDGKLTVYASDEASEGNLDIWIKDLVTGNARRLTYHPAEELFPAISPDNRWIVYRSERNGGGIYAVSSNGGEERLIAERGRDPVFSADGSHLAYWTGEADNLSVSGSKLYVMPFPAGPARQLVPEFADARNPSWAPNGQRLAFLGVPEKDANPDAAAEWWIGNLDGPEKPLATGLQQYLRSQGLSLHKGVVWWKDYLIFAAAQGDVTNIWYGKLLKGGAVDRRLTRLLEGTESQLVPSVSRDGQLIYSTLRSQIGTWRLPLGGRNAPPEMITSSAGNDTSASVSANERSLAFRRRISGVRNVWWKNLDTGLEAALTTSATEKIQPVISPNGSTVAYSEADGGGHSVFLVKVSDRSVTQLCRRCGDAQGWTPDGAKVVVSSGMDGSFSSIAVNTNRGETLFRSESLLVDSVRYSPRADWIAFVGRKDGGARIYVIPTGQGSDGHSAVPLSEATSWGDAPAWSQDGKEVYFRSNRDGFNCLWAVAAPRRLTDQVSAPKIVRHFHSYRSHLDSVPRPAFALAAAGRNLYLTSADIRGGVWASRIQELK